MKYAFALFIIFMAGLVAGMNLFELYGEPGNAALWKVFACLCIAAGWGAIAPKNPL